jgi:hypothetical protein
MRATFNRHRTGENVYVITPAIGVEMPEAKSIGCDLVVISKAKLNRVSDPLCARQSFRCGLSDDGFEMAQLVCLKQSLGESFC